MITVQIRISEGAYQSLERARGRQAKRLNRRRNPIATLLQEALLRGIYSFGADEERREKEAAAESRLVTLTLPKPLFERLDHRAKSQFASQGAILRKLMDDHLPRPASQQAT